MKRCMKVMNVWVHVHIDNTYIMCVRYIILDVYFIQTWPERAIVVLAEQIYADQSLMKLISSKIFFRQIKRLWNCWSQSPQLRK